MLDATFKLGDRPSPNYMLAGYKNARPPFYVKSVFRSSGDAGFYPGEMVEVTGPPLHYKAERSTEAGESLSEPRLPYLHSFPPLYDGGSATTRCVNILVTNEFSGSTPLFFVALLTKANTSISQTAPDLLTMDGMSDGGLRVFDGDTEVTTFQVRHADGVAGDESVSIYLPYRSPNMRVEISGQDGAATSVANESYPLQLVPAMRWQTSTANLAADHDVYIDADGIIYTHVGAPIAVAPAESYDFEQEGFPYLAVEYTKGYANWPIKITTGSWRSFYARDAKPDNIWDIGPTTVPKKLLYRVPLTHAGGRTYSTGYPFRQVLGVYQDGESTNLPWDQSDPDSGALLMSADHNDDLVADVTVIDYFSEVDSVNANVGPTFDTNYFTPGLALKDLQTSVWVRTGRYIEYDVAHDPYQEIIAHATAADVKVAYGNALGNLRDSAGAVFDPTDYTLFGTINYPAPKVEVSPLVYRGKTGNRFQLNDLDLRDLPYEGLSFDQEDVWDVHKRRVVPEIRVTLKNGLVPDIASRGEIFDELLKLIPIGYTLIVKHE